ncbi:MULTISPECIES: NADH-quinone oxidoreductase subunit M [unclassified Actinobaculum]|uniref:NADH-quinone oxidoreductase subunit M n=1 Tax=unclassified Actinobaculum TaxID=2609299 RepID=UPI000D52828B|nr:MULTISPECIES: NADH-quinone oxidoreductase subunit M [unclassified Actinobaculum]AWE42923.1 NADH-quinone oxidoreductase subunit M [Actinobaculum sp. 313]RTE48991.1 NADH-quinone oxidoreductase subunit M [Actinobaculum sp. 352]
MQSVNEAAFPWLSLLIVVAVLAALALWLVRPLRKMALPFGLAVSLAILVVFLTAVTTGFDIGSAEYQLAETYSWIPQLGVSLAWGINGIGVVMIGLATFLVPVVLLASGNEFRGENENRVAGYVGWILFLEAIMIGIFASRDIFLFYVLFELMILPMYFLIGRYGGEKRHRAAIKFVIYSLVGGLIMLVGVIALMVASPLPEGGLLVENISGALAVSDTAQMWIFLSFFIGFAIKAPMFPLHTWLPDTTEQAPAGTSTLLVGVLDKIGTYGMIAFCVPFFPDAAQRAATPIMILAVISILWGGFMAITSQHLMRLIAYTSVSHFGFMVLGIFSGSSVAMTGAILYMVAHGVATGALFLTVGSLRRRGSSYMISDYGGWQRVTPLIAGVFLVAGLASIALPGLSGFIPEYLILIGTYSVNVPLATIAVFGVILAAVYILWPYQRVFTGPRPSIEVNDMDGAEKTVSAVLIAAMLFLGLGPAPVIDTITPAAEMTTVYLSEEISADAKAPQETNTRETVAAAPAHVDGTGSIAWSAATAEGSMK